MSTRRKGRRRGPGFRHARGRADRRERLPHAPPVPRLRRAAVRRRMPAAPPLLPAERVSRHSPVGFGSAATLNPASPPLSRQSETESPPKASSQLTHNPSRSTVMNQGIIRQRPRSPATGGTFMSSKLTGKLRWWALSPLIRAICGSTLIAFAGLCSTDANAEVLLFSANTGGQIIKTGPIFLDLNGAAAGELILNFSISSINQRVSINFNSTCYIRGKETYAQVTLVDPAGSGTEFNAPPGPVDFCFHEDGNESFSSNGVRASIVATARPSQAGTHTVRVRVQTFSLLGDSNAEVDYQALSLTVIR